MSKGYLKLSRKYFDHFLWEEKRIFSKAEAWLDLIQTARYSEEESTKIIDNKMIKIKRGEVIGSYRFLAKRWNWKSLTKVKNFLEFLEKNAQIRTAKEQQITMITLCNYNIYNPLKDSDEPESEQEANSKETASEQQRDETVIKKEGNKGNKESEEENPPAEIQVEILPNNGNLQKLWITTFGRNPKIPEQEETEKLIRQFGLEKTHAVFKEASLKGFKNLFTLIQALDKQGNIKPKDFNNGKDKRSPNFVSAEELEQDYKDLYEGRKETSLHQG